MSKKWLIGFIGASALTLASCGNTGGTGTNETNENGDETSGERTQIRFATWDSQDSLTFQEDLVQAFNESQDEIEVSLEAYGGDFDTILTAGFGANDAPDVMYMWNYPTYHEALEPLDSYIDEEGEEYRDNFYEATWNYNSIDGVVYGIPVGYTTHVLYYNIDLFDEAGVDYPTDEWTWDDLHAAANEISSSLDNIYGFVLPTTPNPYDFEMYLWGNGTAYTDGAGNFDGYLNSSESIEVFETFQEMLADESAIASEGNGTDEMSAETAAIMVNGSWGLNTFNDAGINYAMAPLPNFNDNQSVSVVNSSGLSISSDSEYKEAAWEFVKFWTNDEANIARIDYELPVLQSVLESENLAETENSVFYTMLERSQDFTPTSFIIDNWSTVFDDLSQAFEEIFNPTTMSDPETVLNSLSE